MASLMHLDCAHDEEIELYCDEALDFCAPLFAIPSLPRSSSAADLYHAPLCASPLPRSASAEPLRPLSRSGTPSLESPARKRASPCPSQSPHLLLATPLHALLQTDDDVAFLLASEDGALEPLLSLPHTPCHEFTAARPAIIHKLFAVAAAYHADTCIPFQALSLLDRVLALHSSCPAPPAPSDIPLFALASSCSSSPLSAATTPVLSRGSPLFQALQPQQHPPAHPTSHSPNPVLFPHSSSSSFSSQLGSASAARCATPLSLLSNEFSAIMVNPCPSPQPAASSHSPRGHPSSTSSPGSRLHSPSLLSRKRPAPLTGILSDCCPAAPPSQPPLPCAVCRLAALPCTSLPLPRMIHALAAASLLVSFKFIVDGPVPSAREYAALFDVGPEQLKLAEAALLQALGWCIRVPTVCDFLHVLVERERCAGLLPPHVLQQLQQHAEQYSIRFLHSPDALRFLPSETAAAAWRESLLLWNVQGGRSADIASALAARRSVRAPVLAAAMAAAKAAVVAEVHASRGGCQASMLQWNVQCPGGN